MKKVTLRWTDKDWIPACAKYTNISRLRVVVSLLVPGIYKVALYPKHREQ